MEERADGRTQNQLRPLACSHSILNRAHASASWSQGDSKVLAAVYGPKAGTKKNENPEKASLEVIWKPKTGQIGKLEKEYEMILKRTLQSICILSMNPNTTTSVIIQVIWFELFEIYQGSILCNLNTFCLFSCFNSTNMSCLGYILCHLCWVDLLLLC